MRVKLNNPREPVIFNLPVPGSLNDISKNIRVVDESGTVVPFTLAKKDNRFELTFSPDMQGKTVVITGIHDPTYRDQTENNQYLTVFNEVAFNLGLIEIKPIDTSDIDLVVFNQKRIGVSELVFGQANVVSNVEYSVDIGSFWHKIFLKSYLKSNYSTSQLPSILQFSNFSVFFIFKGADVGDVSVMSGSEALNPVFRGNDVLMGDILVYETDSQRIEVNAN